MKNGVGEREFYEDMKCSCKITSEPILILTSLKNCKITKNMKRDVKPYATVYRPIVN